MLRIDQNVEIWVQNVKPIKMMKFEWKGEIDQNVQIWVKGGINENIEIWRQVENQSKCWNLSANFLINPNVEI